jgi:hypothetical protein
MLPVSRREYKVMLDHQRFADRKRAAKKLGGELRACCSRLKVSCNGEFDTTDKREIAFLDTANQTIRENYLVFRQRFGVESGETEYTLKCRSPDRYVAAGANLRPGKGLEDDPKFEEDIGTPFVSRFSRSNTVFGPEKAPGSFKEAAKLFPVLGNLKGKGQLQPVSPKVYERVLRGPKLKFGGLTAEIALIVWSDGPDSKPVVAEFSFRYKRNESDLSPTVARQAMEFFDAVQRLDWCLPEGRTKTQYAYGIG